VHWNDFSLRNKENNEDNLQEEDDIIEQIGIKNSPQEEIVSPRDELVGIVQIGKK